MSVTPSKLKLVATNSLVDAELHDDLLIEPLFDAEERWAPERVRVQRDCVLKGVRSEEVPQSVHWSWSLKALRMHGFVLGPLSTHRLFGVRADNDWQGLLLACCVGYRSRLINEPRDLVYVDFVEVAPWNWELKAVGRVARFRGIGRQLMELAVRWSDDLGFKGRVGLHSLPQAEEFYGSRCGMTDLGLDSSYRPPLRYLELSETNARTFLGE